MTCYAQLQPTQFCAVPTTLLRAAIAKQWYATEDVFPGALRSHYRNLLQATVMHGGSREVARNVLLALREIARLDRAFATRMATEA